MTSRHGEVAVRGHESYCLRMNNLHEVARHKTAIGRTTLSRPMKLAIADGLVTEDKPFFDYGCGRGDDLRIVKAMGFDGAGWDPVHRPEAPIETAPIVNLGYVVNVIEDVRERIQTLRRAWSLAEQVLIVSARLAAEAQRLAAADYYADGRLTSRGTFQKFYEQHELKNWIDQTLEVSALPAGPGVFYVFRDDEARSAFMASRFRRQVVVPRLSRPVELFEQNKDLLQPLIDFMADRGRLPADDELPNAAALHGVFGTTKRAFRVIVRATETEPWKEITDERAQDLLIYLALARFDGRPTYSRLPRDIQLDVKAFFASYSKACGAADQLLFSAGDMEAVDNACSSLPIGKLTPEALYVHEGVLERLPAVLRVFEGCARAYIGRVEGANIIKLRRREPKISYLSYPDFNGDPHPALESSLSVHLQTFRVKTRDYRAYRNPPILHRKETLIASDDPRFAKFARLTRIEEKHGLYEDARRIGTRDGWNAVLGARGLRLNGHRLLRSGS